MSKTDTPHYGYALMKETGLKSGTLYPILRDMSSPTGRPPRQHYELTPLGINYAHEAVTSISEPSLREITP